MVILLNSQLWIWLWPSTSTKWSWIRYDNQLPTTNTQEMEDIRLEQTNTILFIYLEFFLGDSSSISGPSQPSMDNGNQALNTYSAPSNPGAPSTAVPTTSTNQPGFHSSSIVDSNSQYSEESYGAPQSPVLSGASLAGQGSNVEQGGVDSNAINASSGNYGSKTGPGQASGNNMESTEKDTMNRTPKKFDAKFVFPCARSAVFNIEFAFKNCF